MDRVTRLLPLIALAIVLPLSSASVSAQTLAAGSSHTVVRTPDGSVWIWGLNNSGQLGDGTNVSRAVPTQIPSLSDVTAVAAGAAHTLVLKSDGTVWAFGNNSQGQLGDGSTTHRTSPVLALGLTNVVAIAAGAYHSVALTSSGAVWTWGNNANGQLGDGTTTRAIQPLVVTSLTASAIGAGWNHTLAAKTDGSVAVWGANGNGQLGDGSTTQRTTPVTMSSISTAVAVAGGSAHSLVLLADGSVKAAGLNSSSALGDGTTTQRTSPVSVSSLTGVVAVAAGQHSSYAVKSDGSASAWGGNASAQLGDGTWTQRNSPVAISGLSGLAALAAGDTHAIAVTIAGVVSTWGSNGSAKLGDGTASPREVPGAISEAAYLWKVGAPLFSATGSQYTERAVTITTAPPGATIHYTTNGDVPTELDAAVSGPIDVTHSQIIKARAFKGGHAPSEVAATTYTLIVATPMFSPGSGTYTSARTVTITTTSPGVTIRYTLDGSTPTEASAAYVSALTVGTTTTVKAMGFRTGWTQSSMNSAAYTMNFGTLAPPPLTPTSGTFTSEAVVTMTAFEGATIRYTTNGSAPTLSSTAYAAPLAVAASSTIRAKAFHPDYTASAEATATYTITVATPVLTPTSGIYSAGQTIVVTTATPGATIRYTLNGNTPSTSDPVIASGGSIIAGNFTLRAKAWKTGATESDTATAVYSSSGSLTSASLAGGTSHSLAVRPDGVVFAWGTNTFGQLGDGTATTRPLPVLVNGASGIVQVASREHSLAVSSSGDVYAWGPNGGRLGDGTTTNRSSPTLLAGINSVASVAAGSGHSVALKSDGTVWTWGANSSGQLGMGNTTQQLSPVQALGLTNVSMIAAADNSTYSLSSDGTLSSWGMNGNGQLGIGSTASRSTPGPVTGLSGVAAVSAGGTHVLALLADGSIKSWGFNLSGQLGDDSNSQRTAPVAVSGIATAVAVAAGQSHSLALLADGSVWAWGSNGRGQVGDGTQLNRRVPVAVNGLPQIIGIAAGGQHSLALGVDGSVWAWGRNDGRQLGDGTSSDRLTPVQIADAGMAWKVAAPALSIPSGLYYVEQSVTVSAPDPDSTLHYTLDGSEPTEQAPTIASGVVVVVDQTASLKVRAWKPGAVSSETTTGSYQLKVVTPSMTPEGGTFGAPPSVTITTTTSGATLRYTLDATEPTTGSDVYAGALVVTDTRTIKARGYRTGWTPSDSVATSYWVTAGTVATPVISPDWGTAFTAPVLVTLTSSSDGATIRFTVDGSEPSAGSAVYKHAILIDRTTTIKARAFRVGYASSGIASATFALDAAGAAGVPAISPAGGRFATKQTVLVSGPQGATLRYTTDGVDPTELDTEVPSNGQLSIEKSLILKVRAWAPGATAGAVRRADFVIIGDLRSGHQHTVALKSDGTVVVWGYNGNSQLGSGAPGTGSTDPVPMLTGVKAIAAGFWYSLAVKENGTVWIWGSGPRGNGTYGITPAPVQVAGLMDVVAVAAGYDHALALKSDGSVWAWGKNLTGQIGDGSTTDRLTAVQVPGLSGITSIAAGDGFSLAVQQDGGLGGLLWSWGKNASGQLGDGSTLMRSRPVRVLGVDDAQSATAGEAFGIVRLATGAVWAWGRNSDEEVGGGFSSPYTVAPAVVAPLGAIVALSAGQRHSVAADADGYVWGWGRGAPLDYFGPPNQPSSPSRMPDLTSVIATGGGQVHGVFLKIDGTVWATGSGKATGLVLSGAVPPTQILGLLLADNAFLLTDTDGDGLRAWEEYAAGTDPLSSDTNGNGLSDLVDVRRRTAAADPDDDGDGVPNSAEIAQRTDPFSPDTDGDGVGDCSTHFPSIRREHKNHRLIPTTPHPRSSR